MLPPVFPEKFRRKTAYVGAVLGGLDASVFLFYPVNY